MLLNLLIVDDSEYVRASLIKLIVFTNAVSSIREVGTLAEALAEVQRDPPTLVILDLYLPDGFGMDIIRRIKEISPTSSIAIVTMHAEPEYRQRCLALGAGWFFDKATDYGLLLQVIRQLASPNTTMDFNPNKTYE